MLTFTIDHANSALRRFLCHWLYSYSNIQTITILKLFRVIIIMHQRFILADVINTRKCYSCARINARDFYCINCNANSRRKWRNTVDVTEKGKRYQMLLLVLPPCTNYETPLLSSDRHRKAVESLHHNIVTMVTSR